MKKWWIILSNFILVLFTSSCNLNLEYDVYDVLANLKPWRCEYGNDEDMSVALKVNNDIDYLFWCKGNGEVIEIGKLNFPARKEPYIFKFGTPGEYILNIHLKKQNGVNSDDADYRGKVYIGNWSVHLSDNGYADKCSKQARFTINNDSAVLLNVIHNKKRPGNVMTEFIYIEYDSNKTYYDYKYKTKMVFKGIKLTPGKSATILLPVCKNNDVKKNGFLLKKVINDGKEIYYGNTTTGIYQEGFGSPMGGAVNNDFIPIGNDMFYSDWNWRHN